MAISPLIEATYPDPGARLVDLDALVAASAKAARLSDVAADFALEPPRSTSDLAGTPMIDEDWLTVSTVHSAKGLEWNVVHILNVTDGMIPSDMALGSNDGLEEERRVFYVALTRARSALHVYVPSRYHHRQRGRDDSHGWTQPSRFLSDSVRSTFDEVTVALSIGGQVVQPIGINGLDRISSDLEALWS
jgi:DNA helicase-2/ATP-dependent DNA helicase PcrA